MSNFRTGRSVEINQELEHELFLLQTLYDNEVILRYLCKVGRNKLDWSTICEVILPNNPKLAKRRLLEYLSDDWNEADFVVYNMISHCFIGYTFDINYYDAIRKLLIEMLGNNYNSIGEFLRKMVKTYEDLKQYNPSIEKLFQLVCSYYVRQNEMIRMN